MEIKMSYRSMRPSFAALVLLGTVGCASTKSVAPESSENNSAAATPGADARPAFISQFDASKGQLPEGLAITKAGDAFVGFAPLGEIVRVNLADGKATPFGSVPKPVENQGFMTGLLLAPNDDLLAALVSFAPQVAPGIYRVGKQGGAGALWAKHAEMSFPNGMTFDDKGNLYVTDSGAGAIFRVSPNGETEKWLSDPLLRGEKDYCGKGVGASFDIGANGITRIDQTLYVTNNDRASVIAIAVGADGKPGAPRTLVAPSCDGLGGADGIVATSNRQLVVAANRLNRLVHVGIDGSTDVLTEGDIFDFPASIDVLHGELIATNFALFTASAGQPARPGLLRIATQ